jgi:hypothetical protein
VAAKHSLVLKSINQHCSPHYLHAEEYRSTLLSSGNCEAQLGAEESL